MGMASMTVRRVRKLIAWIFAFVVVALLVAGLFWVAAQLGLGPLALGLVP